jgi:hypothetical protein
MSDQASPKFRNVWSDVTESNWESTMVLLGERLSENPFRTSSIGIEALLHIYQVNDAETFHDWFKRVKEAFIYLNEEAEQRQSIESGDSSVEEDGQSCGTNQGVERRDSDDGSSVASGNMNQMSLGDHPSVSNF